MARSEPLLAPPPQPPREIVASVEHARIGYPGLVTLAEGNVSFRRGEVSCIIGGSGCGKSTLLKVLIGLLPPLAGEIRVLGENLYALEEDQRTAVLKRVGVLFQNGALINSLSVAENIMLPMRRHTNMPEAVMRATARLKLRQVGLEHALEMLPEQLSGGMKKRAALARALALDPELLFCDEPSAGLDPLTGAGLDRLLLDLRRVLGISVIVVTHELNSIRAIADRIVMLAPGRLVFSGPLAEATASTDPDLASFFGRKASKQDAGGSLLGLLTEAP
jgi:phospholipid/cholesterol/gamma-HCH transport system ATP-binding protein